MRSLPHRARARAERIQREEAEARRRRRAVPAAAAALRPRRGVDEGRSESLRRLLSAAERADALAAKGDAAASAAVEQFRRLEAARWRLAMTATRVARAEARRHVGPFIGEEDLMQEGVIGLLRAARRFDPSRGIRFATYARWWARAQITRAVDQDGRHVRLPACAADTLRKLKEARDVRERDGMPAHAAALARDVGVDEDRAIELLSHGYTVSLDTPIEGNRGSTPRSLGSLLKDNSLPPLDDLVAVGERMERIRYAISRVLTDQQRRVVVRRYGLDDGTYRTLSAVGAEMGLSRERVRQIERDAVRRIRRRCDAPIRRVSP